MSEAGQNAEWYYVGHYGQLGPLTLDQISELVDDGVIDKDTYVWRNGMPDWTPAAGINELSARLSGGYNSVGQTAYSDGPTPPAFNPQGSRPLMSANPQSMQSVAPKAHMPYTSVQAVHHYHTISAPESDKSRTLGGLLNFIPGIGRMYLGYSAHGVIQLLLTIFCGVGLLWAWVDAIVILAGGVKYDGYGRLLKD
ncbi:MAG: DUF4339 domain-containing protein [Armatimonadetes bacterium]|nr:DUF4339 domain-containing protein [Armatimonadota bacterium]